MRAHPQSLVDRARLLSQWHNLQDVAAILGLQPSQITAFKQRGWREAISGAPKRPQPNDFAFQARRMSFNELTAHYRAGNSTIQRWLAELPCPPRSRRGECLRRDPRTGKRVWQLRREQSHG